jgi:hypothetical protein
MAGREPLELAIGVRFLGGLPISRPFDHQLSRRSLTPENPGQHRNGRRGSIPMAEEASLNLVKVSVRIRGAAPCARKPNRQEAGGREPRQCRFESDRAYQFAPVAQLGRGVALRTRRFSVRIRAGVRSVPAEWSATSPENWDGCLTGRGSIPQRSARDSTTGAVAGPACSAYLKRHWDHAPGCPPFPPA